MVDLYYCGGLGEWRVAESREAAPSGEARQASGFPSPAMDYEEGRIDLNRELIASPLSTFLMRMPGDAMRPDGIHNGDLLVIDRGLAPGAGCLVVAVWEGRFIVRRLCLGPDRSQRPRLEASDGVSPPIALDDGRGEGADLWGVVRHAVRQLEPRPRDRSIQRRGRFRRREDERREP